MVQLSKLEGECVLPLANNPYEDMNYNDCELLPPNLSILIDAISTQQEEVRMDDQNNSNGSNSPSQQKSPTDNFDVNNNNNNNNNNDENNNNNNNNLSQKLNETKKHHPHHHHHHHHHHNPSLKDYEISKLPLRKRHLVPDSAYYNIHQCLSSPQSPPTPKQSPPCLFSSTNGTIKVEMSVDYMEQRVPSPNHRKEDLNSNSSSSTTSLLKTTEEDDVDVGGIEEEINVNQGVEKKKLEIKERERERELKEMREREKEIREREREKEREKEREREREKEIREKEKEIREREREIREREKEPLIKIESDQEVEIDILDDVDIIKNNNNLNNNNNIKQDSLKHETSSSSNSNSNSYSKHHNRDKKRSKSHKKDHGHREKKIKQHHPLSSNPSSSSSSTTRYTDSGGEEIFHSDKEMIDQSSSESEDETDYDNKLYCICRKKYDSNSFMIACDKCDEWYHGECVNVSEKDAKRIDKYVCSKCQKKYPTKQPSPSPPSNLQTNNNHLHLQQVIMSSTILAPQSPRLSPKSPKPTSSPILEVTSNGNQHQLNNNNTQTKQINSVVKESPSKPDLRKCAYPKCNLFATGPSKYCTRECGVANAKEYLIKSHQSSSSPSNNIIVGKSVLASPSSPTSSNIISAPVSNRTSPAISDSLVTQQLLSTSNCDDISRLSTITTKRNEIESKLKKLEQKSNEFEKNVQMTQIKIQSNNFLNNEQQQQQLYTNNNNQITDNNQNGSTTTNNNSNEINQPCTFINKDSVVCGVLNCTNHTRDWEKKVREMFTKKQSIYTKALRDVALEEKQIKQRIARRNKIQIQSSSSSSSSSLNVNIDE